MNGSVLELWQVEYNSGIPVYRQIITQACAAVARGTIKAGDQLPTIRALSDHLNVNPNTVAKAYRELELKGVILTERGNGSFVQAQPAGARARCQGKRARLKNLYQRLLTEAASSGLSEKELLNFMKERNA